MKYDEAYRLARKALAEHWAHDPPPLDLSKRVSIDAIGRGDAWAMYVRLWPSWAALPRDLTDAESREQGITLVAAPPSTDVRRPR